MSNSLKIVSELPVTLNNYLAPRIFYKTVGLKKVPMVMMYETTDAKRFKNSFKKEFEKQVKDQGWVTSPDRNDFYVVHATWFFDKQNRDSNNMWKIMLDAITDTELIWIDDRQTIERTLRISYDTINPRVELDIFKAPWVGIFNSQVQHDEFVKNNCENCSKKQSSCSFYKNALESRIKPDETDGVDCFKIKIPKSKKGK